MPIAQFQLPDGRIGEFEVPEGTTEEQAMAMIQQHIAENQEQFAQTEEAQPANTWGMPGLDAVKAGVGTVARGVGSLPAMAIQGLQQSYNLIAPEQYQISPENMALNNLYATTMQSGELPGGKILEGGIGALTGAGAAGSVAKAASGRLQNMAKTMASRPAAAGVAGMTSAAGAESAKDMGAGQVGQTAAAIAAGMAPAGASALAQQALKTTVQPGYRDVLTRSQQAGLSVPPGYVTNTPGMAAVEGLAGKAKMQQQFSVENAPVIDSIAKKELGFPEHAELSPEAFDAYRATRGKAYQAVKQAFEIPGASVKIKADDAFKKDLENLGGDYGLAADEFSDLFKSEAIDNLKSAVGRDRFSAEAAVEAVRKLRKDASANLKVYDPEKNAIGYAQKDAANAIDDLIERNLEAIGKGDLARAYKQARVEIAKSHDLEAATDPTTYQVSATRLAAIAKKKDMTGGMKTIADFGQAFPKAAQDPSKIGTIPTIGNLEALGAIAANPVVAIAGPVARGVLGTKGYQRSMVRERGGATADGLGSAARGTVQGVAQAAANEPSPAAPLLAKIPQLAGAINDGMTEREIVVALSKVPQRQHKIASDWVARHGTADQKAAFRQYYKFNRAR